MLLQVHYDGIIFLLHHFATASLAMFGLHPFAHLYGAFFFGISELSTAVLCLLALFGDESQPNVGCPALTQLYPNTKKVLGGLFAVLFIVFRVMIWPYLSYHFWCDCLQLLSQEDRIHSAGVVYVFLGSNIFLTALQILWLSEIVAAIKKELK